MGLEGAWHSVDALAEVGVKRISLGAALSRAALGAFLRAAQEIKEHGTFHFLADTAPFSEVSNYMRASAHRPG